MDITATLINLYHVCKRELWLHANNIRFEHTSDLVYDGKLIHENSYPQRPERYEELEIDGCKIDFYDARNKIIHEIKRSDKVERAHQWQVKYYIFVLEQNGIDGVTGLLEYPTLRHTEHVNLSDEDRKKIEEIKTEIVKIIHSDDCPPVINARICKSCSYYEFCYVEEEG
ncbi:CRISPR-associated protein Cas4 [Limibacterium fermenti]|jgi:CRISPR-associated exonuclease Cas4|uniref:CRISPR-associated protein Cas4 n=1 Tax=Limibacterium fermenti TaxID=3229863 RepID=UPI000E891045|nr:CRISPR-associated protein Cas4 [Porphyromonadaceae bacterium]HBK30595.1 CRISPR-associated protein Cas4 [Porphyromonadaceae bacterium]HBX20060.1 CRISPR-associated protein Cas4 [Porphyromonadaceae bacterium]